MTEDEIKALKASRQSRLEGAITPTNGRGGYAPRYSPPPITVKPPTWDYWRHMPTVKPWQACALALNIEPNSVDYRPKSWDGQPETWDGFPSEVVDHFIKLLQLLDANQFEKQHFTENFSLGVRLSEFAAWCAHVGFAIPPELSALAALPERPQVAPKVVAVPVTSPSGDAAHILEGLEVFRSMPSLSGDELNITFIGGIPENDKADLGANNMLKISARNATRTVALASLDLVNKQRGGVNGEGAILIGFMQGKEPLKNEANATKICRLRNIFKKHLGITSSPFQVKALGWKPRFKIEDKRGAGEERNKREIERYKIDSLDEMNARGEMASDTNQTQQSSEENYPFNEEDDDAAVFLRDNNA